MGYWAENWRGWESQNWEEAERAREKSEQEREERREKGTGHLLVRHHLQCKSRAPHA